jgi:hypothetical protein
VAGVWNHDTFGKMPLIFRTDRGFTSAASATRLQEEPAMVLSETKTGRERASGNAERHYRPGIRPAVEHARRTAPSRAAFWLVAGVLCLLFCAAGAPSPLYGIYRAQLRFSATTLTAVFAIYALVLLGTLLVFGSVSDYLGRRRVILAALVVTAGATCNPRAAGWRR